MNFLGTTLLIIAILLIWTQNRTIALLSFFASILYLPQSQNISVLGISFTALRFVEIATLLRVVLRKEWRAFHLNNIDVCFLFLYVYSTSVFLIRSDVDQAYTAGLAVDALLTYFPLRCLITDGETLRHFLRGAVFLLVPYACLLLVETLTGSTPFQLLGAEVIGWNRNGRPRCVGSFRNPSLLGTLGAAFLPLYIGLYAFERLRQTAKLGIFLCLFIAWSSNSGGPFTCVVVGLFCWLVWPFRNNLYLLRRTFLLLLLAIGLLMKAPIWYLLSKTSSLTGGDGYHRARLLDQAFQHLDQWWMLGMPVRDTADWFPYVLRTTGGADITNYFLSFGISSGLISMSIFIVLLWRSFNGIGRKLKSVADLSTNETEQKMFWALGAMLTVHCFNWLGIIYFDQTQLYWLMQLAFISTLTNEKNPPSDSAIEFHLNAQSELPVA